jgi:dTDP-4-dehydrorhamnose reductase
MAIDHKYGQVTVEKPPTKHPFADDEPVFILRASDNASVMAIRDYLNFAYDTAVEEAADDERPDSVVRGAFEELVGEAAQEFEKWREANADKCHLPD